MWINTTVRISLDTCLKTKGTYSLPQIYQIRISGESITNLVIKNSPSKAHAKSLGGGVVKELKRNVLFFPVLMS